MAKHHPWLSRQANQSEDQGLIVSLCWITTLRVPNRFQDPAGNECTGGIFALFLSPIHYFGSLLKISARWKIRPGEEGKFGGLRHFPLGQENRRFEFTLLPRAGRNWRLSPTGLCRDRSGRKPWPFMIVPRNLLLTSKLRAQGPAHRH